MSDMKAAASSTAVECIIPILSVASVAASIRYYTGLLGFRLDWADGDDPRMASVSRDGKAIMLCQEEQGHPDTWVWIGVEDIDPLVEEYRRKGVTFRQEPTNYSWAYEMRVEDPDGHVLRFGSEPRRDLPVSGAA